MNRNWTTKKDISKYDQFSIMEELNECFDLIIEALNPPFHKKYKKTFGPEDYPSVEEVVFFKDEDREENEIPEDYLAFTEPANLMSIDQFRIYVYINLIQRNKSNLFHNVIMHEAIHMIVDGLLGKRFKMKNTDQYGHNDWFKWIAKIVSKKYNYDNIGIDGFIENR